MIEFETNESPIYVSFLFPVKRTHSISHKLYEWELMILPVCSIIIILV